MLNFHKFISRTHLLVLTATGGTFAALVYILLRKFRGTKTLERNTSLVHISECGSNEELVNHLVSQKFIRSKRVEHAMRTVDRRKYCHDFVQDGVQVKVEPYHDAAMPIPYNATISAPHMHATCLEAVGEVIELKKNETIRVLDVGSGSGYITACLTHMILYENKYAVFYVFGIDHIPSLVEIGKMNVANDEKTMTYYQNGRITFTAGDGFSGIPDQGPFDIIHVGASCEGVPQDLFDQLAVGGRMILPLGDSNFYQSLTVLSKNVNHQRIVQPLGIKCRFVPLTDADTQLTKTHTRRVPKLFKNGEKGMIVMPFIISADDSGIQNLQDIKWDTGDDI